MLRLLQGLAVLVIAVIALPPLWFALFPETPNELPPAGKSVLVAPEVNVNVLDEGAGPPLVFVHGLPGSAYDWRETTALLRDAGYRTIAYDRVGYGRSDPRPSAPYSLSANVNELLALLDALDLSDATVVGWSYGGAIAMSAAGSERIGRIVLVGTGGPDSDDAVPPEANLFARILFSKAVVTWRNWVPPVSRSLQTALSELAFADEPQPDWWLQDLAANFVRPETTEAYRREILAPVEDEGFDPKAIETPTLIVHGDADQLAPVSIGRYLAEVMPNATYIEIEGGSHMLPMTREDVLAEAIDNFVKE